VHEHWHKVRKKFPVLWLQANFNSTAQVLVRKCQHIFVETRDWAPLPAQSGDSKSQRVSAWFDAGPSAMKKGAPTRARPASLPNGAGL